MKWLILVFIIPVFSMPVGAQEFVQVKPFVLPDVSAATAITVPVAVPWQWQAPTVFFELRPEGGLRTILVTGSLIVTLDPPKRPRKPVKLEPGWALR